MRSYINNLNLKSLGSALLALKVAKVEVAYAGSGDSGAIEDVIFYDKDNNNMSDKIFNMHVPLLYSDTFSKYLGLCSNPYSTPEYVAERVPEKFIKLYKAYKSSGNFDALLELDKDNEVLQKELVGLIHDVCYSELADRVGGWEINEGGDGTFTFELFEENGRSFLDISLAHRQAYVDYEESSFNAEIELV